MPNGGGGIAGGMAGGMISGGTLAIALTAKDMASNKMNRVAGGAGAMGAAVASAMQKVSWGMVMAGGAISVFVAKGVSGLIKFRQTATKSLMMFGRVTEERLQTVMKVATEFSMKLGISAEKAAEALYYLGSAGLSLEESTKALGDVLRFARVGMMEVSEAAETALTAMKVFGYEAEDIGSIVNQLMEAVRGAQTTMTQMKDAFKYAAPVAAKAGIASSELSAIIGSLGDVGIRASKAGTTLRRALVNLIAPTSTVQKSLDKLGVSVFTQAGRQRDLVDVLEDTFEAMRNATEETGRMAAQNIFGTRAVAGMLGLMEKGISDIREFAAAIKVSAATEEMWADLQGTAQTQLAKTKQTLNAFTRRLGKGFLPILTKALKVLRPLVKAFIGLDRVTKGLITTILAVVGPLMVLIGLMPVFTALAGTMSGAIGGLMNAFLGLASSIAAATGGVSVILGIAAGAAAGFWALGQAAEYAGKSEDELAFESSILGRELYKVGKNIRENREELVGMQEDLEEVTGKTNGFILAQIRRYIVADRLRQGIEAKKKPLKESAEALGIEYEKLKNSSSAIKEYIEETDKSSKAATVLGLRILDNIEKWAEMSGMSERAVKDMIIARKEGQQVSKALVHMAATGHNVGEMMAFLGEQFGEGAKTAERLDVINHALAEAEKAVGREAIRSAEMTRAFEESLEGATEGATSFAVAQRIMSGGLNKLEERLKRANERFKVTEKSFALLKERALKAVDALRREARKAYSSMADAIKALVKPTKEQFLWLEEWEKELGELITGIKGGQVEVYKFAKETADLNEYWGRNVETAIDAKISAEELQESMYTLTNEIERQKYQVRALKFESKELREAQLEQRIEIMRIRTKAAREGRKITFEEQKRIDAVRLSMKEQRLEAMENRRKRQELSTSMERSKEELKDLNTLREKITFTTVSQKEGVKKLTNFLKTHSSWLGETAVNVLKVDASYKTLMKHMPSIRDALNKAGDPLDNLNQKFNEIISNIREMKREMAELEPPQVRPRERPPITPSEIFEPFPRPFEPGRPKEERGFLEEIGRGVGALSGALEESVQQTTGTMLRGFSGLRDFLTPSILQRGGIIKRPTLGMLHRGERVIPADEGEGQVVRINIENIEKDVDVDEMLDRVQREMYENKQRSGIR